MDGFSNLARVYRARIVGALEAFNSGRFNEADRICHRLLSEPACPMLWRAEANYILGTSAENLASTYAAEAVRLYQQLADRRPENEHYKERLTTAQESLKQVKEDEEEFAKEQEELRAQKSVENQGDEGKQDGVEKAESTMNNDEDAESGEEDEDGPESETSFLFETDLDEDDDEQSSEDGEKDAATEKQDITTANEGYGETDPQREQSLPPILKSKTGQGSESPTKRKHSGSSSSGSPGGGASQATQVPTSSQTIVASPSGKSDKKRQRLEDGNEDLEMIEEEAEDQSMGEDDGKGNSGGS